MKNRIFATLLALAICVSCAVPRTYAMSGVGTAGAIGGGAISTAAGSVAASAVIPAFLAACGIAIFTELTYEEFIRDKLEPLVNQYNRENGTNLDVSSAMGAVVSGHIVVYRETWALLVSFANWVRTKFSLAGNTQGVVMGGVTAGSLGATIVNSDTIMRYNSGMTQAVTFSWSSDRPGGLAYQVSASSGDVYVCVIGSGTSYNVYFFGAGLVDALFACDTNLMKVTPTWNRGRVYGDGMYYVNATSMFNFREDLYLSDGFTCIGPTFATLAEAIAYYNGEDVIGGSDGVDADTGTINIPDVLPLDQDFGALSIPGVGVNADGVAVETAIQDMVTGHTLPIEGVQTVPVVVADGLTITDDGTLTPDTVVISPSDIPVIAGDFVVPGLNSVWPFSIPWDVYNTGQ